MEEEEEEEKKEAGEEHEEEGRIRGFRGGTYPTDVNYAKCIICGTTLEELEAVKLKGSEMQSDGEWNR